MDRFAGTRRGDESSDESDEDAEDALERRALAEDLLEAAVAALEDARRLPGSRARGPCAPLRAARLRARGPLAAGSWRPSCGS